LILSNKDRNQLIKYRLEQAKECIDEVEFQINNKKYKTAINRIYYGMFYSLLALSLNFKFNTSKHTQIIGWFNKNFIHTGKLNKEYGKIINKSFTIRQESDYEPFVNYEKDEVNELFIKMKKFIKAIEEIIPVS